MGADTASSLGAWALWLKILTAGATLALTAVLVVLTLSLYKRRDQYAPTALHFTIANFFAAGYIVADTVVIVATMLARDDVVQLAYRTAIAVLPLALAAYFFVYRCMTHEGWPARRLLVEVYGVGLCAALLPWFDNAYLVVASEQLTITRANIFLDYGAGAAPFFAGCLAVFAVVSYRILRHAPARKSAGISLVTGFGFAVFLLCGIHDALRELGLSLLPMDTLALAAVLFQTFACAVMVWHYSVTLGEQRSQYAQLRSVTDRANRDALSGLYNRCYLEDYMARGGAQARGGLLFVDLDHFKKINDDYGHTTGDRLIQTVAQCMREATRERDIVCRWGGDEFLVLLELGAENDATNPAIERLVRALDQTRIDGIDGLKLSASMGYAEFEKGQWREALNRADVALYEAKRGGRCRVSIAS
ncbi:GGDEF domain-containing protein [Salinisphaera sp. C84B14]|uniref:GGDEF domain-containing protein n=1 Tax=Salinisphaera sp. C84B14 TaxID=1304155 RepID=UPI00333F3153